ncbi:LytR/AlgR family response regulator transcription factor [Portibacter lacus]|uniref:HTH LytTR-type domain-containing protein n=1 Tax=Portibacter lacus TaxID=1099794 RepID=A0AA37SSZ0_9BACT|nr:LytTR family DNA-binding domain-containing protein [Portibacter lacus]GLR19562.1 hypothetical protein GCM10007940_41780 [Portibacter lacus]
MSSNSNGNAVAKVVPLSGLQKYRPTISEQIAIPSVNKIDLVLVSRIVSLNARSNYTEIHFIDGKSVLTAFTLKRYEEKLNKQAFIRVHSGYIIQLKYVKSYNKLTNKITLLNKQEIPVSRSRKQALMNYFDQFKI